MNRSLILDQDQVPALAEAVLSLARDGAEDETVRALLTEAARRVEIRDGLPGAPADVFREAYALALQRFTYLPDAADREIVQPPALTLEQGSGDCEDAAALVLALARGVGLSGVQVLVAQHDGDRAEVVHDFAEVALTPGRPPVAADLAMYLPLGEAWRFGTGTVLHRFALRSSGRRGVGFLEALFGGVLNLFASKNNRAGAERQAEAAVAAARENRAGLEGAARLQAEASKKQSEAALQVAELSGVVEAGRIKSGERTWRNVLSFGRQLAPVVAVTVGVVALAPVLVNLTAPRRSAPVRSREHGHDRAHAPRRAARSYTRNAPLKRSRSARAGVRPGAGARRRAKGRRAA